MSDNIFIKWNREYIEKVESEIHNQDLLFTILLGGIILNILYFIPVLLYLCAIEYHIITAISVAIPMIILAYILLNWLYVIILYNPELETILEREKAYEEYGKKEE